MTYATDKGTSNSLGRPPRTLIRAALRGEAKGYGIPEQVYRLIREGEFHTPLNPSTQMVYTTAHMDPALIASCVEEEEERYQKAERKRLAAAVRTKCYDQPIYLNPFIMEAQEELRQQIITEKKKRNEALEALLCYKLTPENEHNARMRAAARVFEEGHYFSNDFPEEYVEQARAEVAREETERLQKVVETQQQIIDDMYMTFSNQALGLGFKKAIEAEKKSEKT